MTGIRFLRGSESSLPAILGEGEPAFCLDTGNLYVGNGSSNILINTLSGTGFKYPPNVVLVDPSSAVISGERYTSWFDADAYVQTQSPSSINPWVIHITGYNIENIILRDHVYLFGYKTFLAGDVSVVGTNLENCVIIGFDIANLLLDGTDALSVMNSKIKGGTCSAGFLYTANSEVAGGNFSGCNFYSEMTRVTGGQFTDPQISNSIFKPTSCEDGDIINSNVVVGTTPFTGEVEMHTSTVDVDVLTIGDGDTYIFNGCNFINSTQINVPNGATLTTRGCTNLPAINPTGTGTWANSGEAFDNRITGFTAEDVQAALDEFYLGVKDGSLIEQLGGGDFS